ncbi:MAG: hypothetical protein ACI4MY_01690, partial [Christensenellales bacterium]
MIVVVVVALSTATFAWFSASQSATISGTTTITASKEFTVRTWNGTDDWADTDTIQLNATQVTPLAPIGTGLGMVTKGASVDDNAVTSEELAWFTTDKYFAAGSTKAYTTAALANQGKDGGSMANVSSFQMAPVGATGATAVFDIKFEITGQKADDLKALNAMNVVLEITSYANSDPADYIGTTYGIGNEGVIVTTADSNGVDAAATMDDAGKVGTKVTLTNDTVTDLTTGWSGSAILSGANGYYKNGSTSLQKQISGEYALDAGEYVLVNVYVWLDGYEAVDAVMAKAVTVSIGISKKA